MSRLLTILLGLFLIHICYADDITAVQNKSEAICGACHNKDGNSSNPIWPKIAGQHPKYLVLQMQAFKEGKLRNDPSMSGMMASLSTQDMEELAQYFSMQKRSIEGADAKDLKFGERLYRAGDIKRGIPGCIACHGPRGIGIAQAGFPALSGQHVAYTVKQLEDYKQGARKTDLNHIMRDISVKLTKKDMDALANYIAGLH